jgi:3-phosphoshikimate 1-carboxyvinyltransferase
MLDLERVTGIQYARLFMSTNDKTFLTVSPCLRPGGVLTVPGDKSISHRIAMLGALAADTTRVRGFLRSADCMALLEVMTELGATYVFDGDVLCIRGVGGRFQAPSQALDMGNSGTGLRLLAGLLAGQAFTSVLTGDASLRSRPMRRIQEPLERMGARVELLGESGCAPVRITGGRLRGLEYASPVASAQVKSCVLLAGLFAEGVTTVIEPKATRDHTERLLSAMGVPVQTGARRVSLTGYGARGPRLEGRDWVVPGDFSSAAFWITAAAISPGCAIEIRGVGLNPRRSALLDVLKRMGAAVTVEPDSRIAACEAMGTIRVEGRGLAGTEVGGDEIPDLIDELPLVAVAAAKASGRTVIRDAAELRVKESDRVHSVVASLRQLGVQAEERPDGLVIEGGATIRGDVSLDSYGDHRIPMAMSVLALSASGPVRLENIACVNKSYPEFWDDLKKVGGHVE